MNNYFSFKDMTHLTTLIILTTTYFSTILFEIWFNISKQSSSKITLLEHIQSSIISKLLNSIIFIGIIFLILLTPLLNRISIYGKFIIYITFLKFFELIPALIDLINILFIHHYQIKSIDTTQRIIFNASNRLKLSLIFAFIRLILSADIVRRKCKSRSERQIIVVFNLLLYVLISVSLMHYSNKNLFRIGRKIILGLLMIKLNDLFCNETFWIKSTIRHVDSTALLKIIYSMLCIRWFISLFIICSAVFYAFQSISIDHNKSFTFIRHIYTFFFSYESIPIMSMIIFYVIHQDTLQNHAKLDQYGFSRYCIGIDLLSRLKSTETMKKQQTCVVCYDEKDLIEFDLDFPNGCQHVNRSVCSSCLLRHVQMAFQITFTDDIHCPEPECGIKLDYDTVKNILFMNGDDKLVERYDRYVLHRQLEQMDEFIWCSNPLCNIGQLNEGGALNSIVTCTNCHQRTCFIHKVKWHEGFTCQEYEMMISPNDESSRRWIVENSKKCPKCPYQIEKNDGCDHMTCIKCHHQFCWSCLADFEPIRQDGNHRHRGTCKHYAAYKRK